MKGVIYKYTNQIDGKVYVGQTINEYKRRQAHKRCYGIWRSHFHSAIKKYGYSSFKYEILEEYTSDNLAELKNILDARECFYIDLYGSTNPEKGYNITAGGGGTLGVKQSLESNIKRSKALLGRKSPLTEEQWNYIRGCNKYEYLAHSTPIEKYTLDGELIHRFNTIKEAALSVESSYSALLRGIKKRNGVFKGYIWKKC